HQWRASGLRRAILSDRSARREAGRGATSADAVRTAAHPAPHGRARLMPDVSNPPSVDTGLDPQPRRRNLAVVAGGALLLVIGAVAFVLGTRAASNATDDLLHARRRLD